MSSDYLTDLNKEQRRAVKHGIGSESATKAPPLLVIAGAGSGKTKTLAHRVAHLVVSGVDPHRILLLTFTRRAADEMIRRVKRITAKVIGTQQVDLPWSGTFHAIGARLLREYATQIGLKPSFTILDRSDAADLMDLVRHDLGQSTKASRFPKKATCLTIYSFTINSGKSLEQVLADNFPWCAEWEKELRRLFQSYTAAKQRQNVLDYDDLLLYWAEMMRDDDLAAEIGGRFDHILVDEYQDTNRLQSKILLRLKPEGRGLMVVGDDAQSIYSFRAATVRNILEFQASSGPRLTLSLLSKTIDRPNQSSTPATGSSGLPRNDTRRTYGRTGGPSKSPF
jgi:DNA helicase-2/ATP-dependent DNA helicase PcrA